MDKSHCMVSHYVLVHPLATICYHVLKIAADPYPEGIMHRVVVEVAEPLRAEYYN